MTQSSELIDTCAARARELLSRNITEHGVLAATLSAEAEKRSYTRIFGRDHAICALPMILSGETHFCEAARAGLLTLARHQADNGQIPKLVDPVRDEADFWYLGCIDATLWWLLAVDFYDRHIPADALREQLRAPIEKALTWLRCQEHPQIYLLQQNEASDWADIMPRSGFVLYTNALWYRIKQCYALPHADATHYHFNHLFQPFAAPHADYKRLRLLTHYIRRQAGNKDLYLSFVNFSYWGKEGDVFGNLLAILFGLTTHAQANRIIHTFRQAEIDKPHPVRTVLKPIARDDPMWRNYMGRHQQNLAHQYHNGGAWPFIGGFWIMALAAQGKKKLAQEQLQQLAQANAVGDWSFYEWFHGASGEPGGMRGQSWSASMFLLAQHALQHKVF